MDNWDQVSLFKIALGKSSELNLLRILMSTLSSVLMLNFMLASQSVLFTKIFI